MLVCSAPCTGSTAIAIQQQRICQPLTNLSRNASLLAPAG